MVVVDGVALNQMFPLIHLDIGWVQQHSSDLSGPLPALQLIQSLGHPSS